MPDGPKPTVPRKTTAQLIADEEKKSGQLKARLEELKTRQRAEERKKENHRKIIVGAAVLAHIKINPVFRKQVQEALNLAVTDPKHREAIRDVLNERAFMTAVKEMMRLAKLRRRNWRRLRLRTRGRAARRKTDRLRPEDYRWVCGLEPEAAGTRHLWFDLSPGQYSRQYRAAATL